MLNLKVDPEYQHHYLISIAQNHFTKGGDMFLKYKPIHFTNKDVSEVRKAILLSRDKVFQVKEKTCLEIFNVSNLVRTISMFLVSSKINNCSIHHFSSKELIDDEFFEKLVESSNTDLESKTLLLNSKL